MFGLLGLATLFIPNGQQTQVIRDKQAARKPWPKSGPFIVVAFIAAIGLFTVLGLTHALGTHGALVAAIVIPVILAFCVLGKTIWIGGMEGVNSMPRHDGEARQRDIRVLALLCASCPTCHVGPKQNCKPDDRHPYVIVDAKWGTVCHFSRIRRSVNLGFATPAEVIAQFNGHLPEGLNL